MFPFHIKGNRQRHSRGTMCDENTLEKVMYGGLDCGDTSTGRISMEHTRMNEGSEYENEDQIGESSQQED